MLQVHEDPALLHSGRDADELRLSGFDPGSLTRLRDGAYVFTPAWEELFAEGRLRSRARAVQNGSRRAYGAFALTAAAAFHELPLYRVRSDRVDMILAGKHTRHNGPDVVRHHMPLPDEDVVIIDGIRVTSLERTVYDLIRLTSLETAVIAFDAALHHVAWDDATNEYDSEAAERFRSAVQQRVRAHRGARGIRQARFVVSFADGRAGSAGESLSRLWMWQLGVPEPELQQRVEFADGRYALLDFAWSRLRRWGEFDGVIKYVDPRLLAGRSADEVIAAQDRRERRVIDETGWRCDRWGSAEMATIGDFARFLRSIGLHPASAA